MEMRRTNAFELNQWANAENGYYLIDCLFSSGAKNEDALVDYEQQAVIFQASDIVLNSFGICNENNPDTYEAVLEMITTIILEEDKLKQEFQLSNLPKDIDITKYSMGRMLSKVEEPDEQIAALMAIKSIFSDLEAKVNEAIASPQQFIYEADRLTKIFEENLATKDSKERVAETEKLRIEHEVEEIIASKRLRLSAVKIKELINSVINFENLTEELTGEQVKLTKSQIEEIFVKSN